MSKTIANLTLPLVSLEIENVLDTYHYHPYRQAFAIPELREQLIAYVLNCVPACYAMIEEHSDLEADPTLVPRPLRDRLRLMVREGIERLVEENADWVSHHIPPEINSGSAPSSWFG
ncbi:hypothetical protein H6F90_16225 [Trichocoleus sp. FACHB-591]|uniref:hypothetical protein n=1 Tax=Trichocoleus sp. FACHB-591 TaxID=2692872 RepID=UPI001684E95F|nr:hypothetical protein [Trichocoleus sp. FACHB-591]MBD2096681.1 hypothetical protein [Trichocoleus sp. FACHB-591]